MKVIKYRVLLDEENKNILVKESAQLYASEKGQMNTPAQIVHLCNDVLQANRLAEEHLWLLAFNTKNKLLGLFEISHGTVNGSLITPREIFVRLFCAELSDLCWYTTIRVGIQLHRQRTCM